VALEAVRAALARAELLVRTDGTLPAQVTGIFDDTRRLRPDGLFVAVRGTEQDGHAFIGEAAAAGATAVVLEDAERREGLPALVVRDGRRAAAVAAAAFFANPADALRLVAVTGTNGKTTTVVMLRHLFDSPRRGARSASIGTLGVLVGTEGEPFEGGGGLTTPGPVELQRVLRGLLDTGVRTVAMEVSSHSLAQHRVEGVRFAAAVFTNVTRDHLDYHGSMEAYFAAKASLVAHLASDGTAVTNADDPAWNDLAPSPRRVTFGVTATSAQVRALEVRYEPDGSRWRLVTPNGSADVALPLIGDFNVGNALAAAAAAFALGLRADLIAERLSTLPQVPGRLERIGSRPTVLRDYAHTPDALERALTALRPFVEGNLIVVFGAGGDRDRGKRPLMAQVADRLANRIVITSDNPRTEDPERILDDIAAALPEGRYERIEDRRRAIERAIAMAEPGRDVVLLAGKGHETYQVRGTTRLPFDEKQIVARILRPVRQGAKRR